MLDFLLVFLLIYGPKLVAMGFDFVTFACIIALVVHYKYIGRSIYTTAMFFGVLTTAYVLAILLLNGVFDEWWFGRMPRYLLNVSACFALTYSMHARGKGIDLLAYVFFSSVLHSAIVTTQVWSPDFSAFLIGALDNYQESEIRFSGLVRGLTPPSFVMAGSIGLGYYCYVKNRIGLTAFFAGSALIFLACLVMGRAGLYLGFGASVLAIVYDQVHKGRVASVVVVLITVLTAFAIFVLSIDSLPLDPLVISALKYGLEPLFNYLEVGTISSSSIEDFEQHQFVFHNDTFVQYLTGTGLYGRGDPSSYLPTDIAYAHMFSAFGVIGVLLLSASTLSMLVVHRYVIKRCRYLFILMCLLIVCVFAMNYKETVLLTRHVSSLLAFLWATMHFAKSHPSLSTWELNQSSDKKRNSSA